MKEYLSELVRTAPTPLHARNSAREYLQARILATLQRAGAMIPLGFHGGTALRFLFDLPRYSEDLDFALERQSTRYNFRAYLEQIRAEFTREGYAVELKVNDRKTVHSAFVRFPGLLYELDLAPQRSAALAVKLEIDTRPPPGAGLTTTVVRRHVILQLQHHDRASLVAGKLHALLQRPFLKGRDVYDLMWYLGDRNWPSPNLTLLNHALAQTGWRGETVTAENWRSIVWRSLRARDWQNVARDVQPFLASSRDAELLTLDNLERLLLENHSG